jgi:arsenate reductase
MLTIYHNPRCSKSRQTLELIKDNSNKEINIIEYLKEPLTQENIENLLKQLSCSPIEMMRTKEVEFKEQNLKGANDETLIAAMVATPKLIERPIVSNGNKAVIGRPPENALALC